MSNSVQEQQICGCNWQLAGSKIKERDQLWESRPFRMMASSHFLHSVEMVAKIDSASVVETRNKVSFDDLVSETTGGDDQSSVDGLVTVPEDGQVQSEPLPFLPGIYSSGSLTSDLYSCFDPPQNPERMRRRPRYPTIIAAPNYDGIYGTHNWRRVSFESVGSKRIRDEGEFDEDSPDRRHYRFCALLKRLASCMTRSEESRENILRHHEEFEKAIYWKKGANEVLANGTRSQVFDMVKKEMTYIRYGVPVDTGDEFYDTIPDAGSSS
eukprot:scaffold1129_cov164-Amphora_coffeaeformis.AAC.5